MAEIKTTDLLPTTEYTGDVEVQDADCLIVEKFGSKYLIMMSKKDKAAVGQVLDSTHVRKLVNELNKLLNKRQ